MKQWERLSDIPDPGGSKCPDLFELPIDGDANNRRWVFWAGNGNYLIGRFDGTTFTQESGPHPSRFGANDYAAQTYSDIHRRTDAESRFPGCPAASSPAWRSTSK